jgi:hypothetical protein
MYERHITEDTIPGRRLGRHVKHDPRSLAYPFKAASVALTSVKHASRIPILDQGDLGSCTGNATVGALGTEPFFDTLSPGQQGSLNESLAVSIYSKATTLDDYPGAYPPEDTGSDGLDAAKAAQSLGFISGYSHAFSLQDALAALVIAPVIIGIDWHEGFDNPSSSGLVHVSGAVRGGHEVCLDQIDVESKLVWLRNSWSTSWGVDGRACFSWSDFQTLLNAQGDVTVFSPITAPAPTPVPTPPTPTPTPTPGYTPTDVDRALASALTVWEPSIISRITKAGKVKVAGDAWKREKGL